MAFWEATLQGATAWEFVLSLVAAIALVHYMHLALSSWNYARTERAFADNDKVIKALDKMMHTDPEGDERISELIADAEDIHWALMDEFESKNRKEWVTETIQRNLSRVPYQDFMPNPFKKS